MSLPPTQVKAQVVQASLHQIVAEGVLEKLTKRLQTTYYVICTELDSRF